MNVFESNIMLNSSNILLFDSGQLYGCDLLFHNLKAYVVE